MTHQRPIPEDQTSPYPLQPEPIAADAQADTVTQNHAKADEADALPETTEGKTGLSNIVLTVGAAIGVTAAAAVGGLLYSRRRSAKAGTRSDAPAAKPRKASTAKAAATRSPAKKANGSKKSAAASAAPAAAAPKSASKRKSGDDKTKRDGRDSAKVSATEPYEVKYFARKHGLSADEARDIIKAAGSDRKKANKLAESRSR